MKVFCIPLLKNSHLPPLVLQGLLRCCWMINYNLRLHLQCLSSKKGRITQKKLFRLKNVVNNQFIYLILLCTSSPADEISGRFWRRIKNRRRQIRWYDLNNNESTTLLTFTIWNVTFLKNEPFLSNRRLKKVFFLILFFFIKRFLHTFCQKRTFCYPTTFIEPLITHKQFIFKESYTS